MRGVGVLKHTTFVGNRMLYYILMKTFNQSYSEAKKIPLRDVLFFIHYENAMQQYRSQKREQEMNK